MSVSVFTNYSALYIVIFRDPNANVLLQKWLTSNRHAHAKVEDNKLHIYDHNTLSLFIVHWPHIWDKTLIWDCYKKRHIYI